MSRNKDSSERTGVGAVAGWTKAESRKPASVIWKPSSYLINTFVILSGARKLKIVSGSVSLSVEELVRDVSSLRIKLRLGRRFAQHDRLLAFVRWLLEFGFESKRKKSWLEIVSEPAQRSLSLRQLSSDDDNGGAGNSGARRTRKADNSHSTDRVCSICTGNSHIRCSSHTGKPDNQPRFRLKPARQNAAQGRKPIRLPSKQLRALFSLRFTPFLLCCFAREESSLLRIPRRLMNMRHPLLYKSDADGFTAP